MYKQVVADPVSALITDLRKPVDVCAADGRTYRLEPKLSFSSDGWSGPNGEKYESVVLAGGQLKRVMLGGALVLALTPIRFAVTLRHYKPTVAEGFSAASLLQCWTDIFAQLQLAPSDLFLATCDGEAVNAAAARHAPRWLFATCAPHAISSAAKDARKDPHFAAASDSVRATSAFFRGSDKRAGTLLEQ